MIYLEFRHLCSTDICRRCEKEYTAHGPLAFFEQADPPERAKPVCDACALQEPFTMSLKDFSELREVAIVGLQNE